MSEGNVEIVRRLFEVFQEAFKRGDPRRGRSALEAAGLRE